MRFLISDHRNPNLVESTAKCPAELAIVGHTLQKWSYGSFVICGNHRLILPIKLLLRLLLLNNFTRITIICVLITMQAHMVQVLVLRGRNRVRFLPLLVRCFQLNAVFGLILLIIYTFIVSFFVCFCSWFLFC